MPTSKKIQDSSTPDANHNGATALYLNEILKNEFRYGSIATDSKLATCDLATSKNESESQIPFISQFPSNFQVNLAKRRILWVYNECLWKDIGKFHGEKRTFSYREQCFKEKACGTTVRLLALELVLKIHSPNLYTLLCVIFAPNLINAPLRNTP